MNRLDAILDQRVRLVVITGELEAISKVEGGRWLELGHECVAGLELSPARRRVPGVLSIEEPALKRVDHLLPRAQP